MAQLALGVVGAVAGSAFGPLGASIGWSIGAALGGVLFPQKIEGPRLTDLKLQQSVYGGMIPILYGTMRVAGNVIWQTDLQEHEEKSGGKGGPTVTNYTYSASFAIRFCEGEIAGCSRVWADGRLVYDTTQGSAVSGDNDFPFTLYLGTEDQLPDPTMEAILGVGNVPAYRGLALMVFDDIMLTDYGNRIPQINAELYTNGSGIPRRISTFEPFEASPVTPYKTATYDPTTETITAGMYTATSYTEEELSLDGTSLGAPVTTPLGDTFTDIVPIRGTLLCGFLKAPNEFFWYDRGVFLKTVADEAGIYGGPAIFQNDFVYTAYTWIGQGIQRFPAPGGVPAAGWDARFALGTNPGDIHIGASDNGRVYVFDGGNSSIYEFDADLALLHTWTVADYPVEFGVGDIVAEGFCRYRNFFCFVWSQPPSYTIHRLNLLSIAADNTLSLYPQDRTGDVPDYVYVNGPLIKLRGGLVLGLDGVTSLDGIAGPVTLASIVLDQSVRDGSDLDEADVDVSDLPDLVPGFLITEQATRRRNIEILQNGYFFDGAEIDDVIVFRKRNHASIATIPDGDLAARERDAELPAPLGSTRGNEVELPARINVDYIDNEADYQNGTQAAERQVTQSQEKQTMSLPIAMNSTKAKAIANTHIFEQWLERDKGAIYLPRKWAKLTPTDVITVKGRTYRVRNVSETPKGVLKLDIVPTLASVYTQPGAGVVSTGMTTGGQTLPTKALTALLLLDIPLVIDGDAQNGVYAALRPAADGAWPGAGLYKSSDDGASYSSIATTSAAATTGATQSSPGDFLGGNVFDEINQFDVLLDNGELSGTSELAVLNGANMCIVGDELLQFKNATLIADNTYTISGLLRGRRGTEWAIGSHVDGEDFVLMSTAIRADAPYEELGQSRKYKGVTFGATLASAAAEDFSNSGMSLRPYSVVGLGGGRNDAGDILINWQHRTRVGGAWLDYVDVPLGEVDEDYVVSIFTDGTYSTVMRSIGVGTTTVTYGAADQTTDFGSPQSTVYVGVVQRGLYQFSPITTAAI